MGSYLGPIIAALVGVGATWWVTMRLRQADEARRLTIAARTISVELQRLAALAEASWAEETRRKLASSASWVTYRFDLSPLAAEEPNLWGRLDQAYHDVDVYRDHGKGSLLAEELRSLSGELGTFVERKADEGRRHAGRRAVAKARSLRCARGTATDDGTHGAPGD